MDWADGPATFKQLRFLERHGFKPGHPLTKAEASTMIIRYGGRPEEFAPLPVPAHAPQIPPADAGHAPHDFRIAVNNARLALTNAETRNLAFKQQSLNSAIARRQQFWLDTCAETAHMKVPSRSVMDLHQKHGCCFMPPTAAQVQEILDALDSASPCWDHDCPEVFFQTLSLNFPLLLRHH